MVKNRINPTNRKVQMNINEIKPNPNNPRIIKDVKFKQLVKSIQDFPQMLELRPIVIDENNMVLGGNMRLKACIEAGLTDVPVIHANNLSEDKKKEFIVKDNVGYGEWDWDDLANNWDAEELTQWGLDIPNFDVIDEKEQIDLSDKLKSEFKIEIICKSEEEQEQTYNKLIEQNYECRILTL
jgi:ParB-like chromosome segregation protein Spo0J